MKTGTNLWRATRYPDRSIENVERAFRIWDFLEETQPPVLYKNIQERMGLSYRQTIRALGLLCELGIVHVTVTADWNGCHYVYPHRVWLTRPSLL
jgi:hypothetical protein